MKVFGFLVITLVLVALGLGLASCSGPFDWLAAREHRQAIQSGQQTALAISNNDKEITLAGYSNERLALTQSFFAAQNTQSLIAKGQGAAEPVPWEWTQAQMWQYAICFVGGVAATMLALYLLAIRR